VTGRKVYEDSFYKNLNKLTGIPIGKIKDYAKDNNPFNILEHPSVIDLTDRQLDKINKLNDFVSTYNVLRMEEENARIQITCPQEAGDYFNALIGNKRDRERFMVAFLDTSNKIIETKTISEGTVDSAVIYPRDVLKMALANDCKGILLAHNHPSGKMTPSSPDIAITQRMLNIFKPLDIKIIDHVIVSAGKYVSFAEEQILEDLNNELADYKPIKVGEDTDLEDDLEM
jgi:DNA repair protein RadC